MVLKSEWQLLRFQPIYQERVWGGRRLETLYGRELPKDGTPYGESWEICDREEAQSVVTGSGLDGWTLNDLWVKARREVFGEQFADHPGERFPLLLKILDSEQDLSIQVHPNDGNAAEVNGEAKSEAWYVAHAAPGAKLYAGLAEGVTRSSFETAIADGTLASQVQVLPAFEGGCVAIHGGVVHAIGAGLVIFEIQQNSDTTFRVFDWNRVGLDGKPRELHQQEALQVTDFEARPVQWQRHQGKLLLDWPYFRLSERSMTMFEECSAPDDFVIGAVVDGEIAYGRRSEELVLKAGDFFILPAAAEGVFRKFRTRSANAKLLWVQL